MTRKLPDPLTTDERTALLAQPNKYCPTGLRNLILLRLMLNAGLRAAEVLGLEPRDIDLTTGRLKVRQGKGRRDRILWLGDDDLHLLRRWQEKRPASQWLLPTLAGKKLQSRYLRQMVKRYGVKAGIQKDIHPHLLRHTMATDLYRQSKDIRLVQRALGHSDLSTTMIYTHIADMDLEAALKALR